MRDHGAPHWDCTFWLILFQGPKQRSFFCLLSFFQGKIIVAPKLQNWLFACTKCDLIVWICIFQSHDTSECTACVIQMGTPPPPLTPPWQFTYFCLQHWYPKPNPVLVLQSCAAAQWTTEGAAVSRHAVYFSSLFIPISQAAYEFTQVCVSLLIYQPVGYFFLIVSVTHTITF